MWRRSPGRGRRVEPALAPEKGGDPRSGEDRRNPPSPTGASTLDRQDGEDIDQLAVDRLVFLDGAVDRDVGNLVIADTYHDIALTLLDGLDAGVAETAGEDAVKGTRGTATLEMTENRHADIILRILLADTVGVIHCTAILGTLGNNYDTAVLALTESTADELLQLVHIRLVLRDDRSLGTGSDGTVLRQETGITAHYLDEEDAVMRRGGITKLVHTLHDSVESRVITDCGICAVKIIVNGARQADYREIIFTGEILGSRKRTVSADDDEGVDTVRHEIVISLLPALRCHEILAAGSLENRTATLNGIADTLCSKLFEFTMQKALVTPIDTYHLHSVVNGTSGHRTDTSVHTRRITA